MDKDKNLLYYTYLSSLRIIMLFWHKDSLVLLAPTMSLMNAGQLAGHSNFRIYKKYTALCVSVTTYI